MAKKCCKEKPVLFGILVPVGKPARRIQIGDDLGELQELVHGFIEAVHVFTDRAVCIICNEEGALIPLKKNREFFRIDYAKKTADWSFDIYGDFLIIGSDIRSASFKSLSPEQLHVYEEMFSTPVVYLEN